MQVVTAQKTAAEENRKRKECELYLERILKDIESKAPLIASQRRDYGRVLEAHSQLSQQVDVLACQGSEQVCDVTMFFVACFVTLLHGQC